MEEIKVGDKVRAHYKSGTYIGEVTDIRPQHYLVRVLAVVKHPMQGDLHSPKDGDALFFHERKALAYREQTNVPLKMVKHFEEDIPDYTDSLKLALKNMKQELEGISSPWAEQSLKNIASLEKDYFK
ncbi:kinase-associated protein B [Cytobacillus eiseniae]|uniref:Kinase-associated protein B n=1 Tax=Cytobacillus eiseniae TaxID=762947 RepID=A0ABS4RCP4_9BACI|nr:kinase-associated lipoprotein B [Cytobacillus eiseniae]MBP2240484.1 kinase-associated protein B [Cytobacillus eiseniae]